MAVPVPIIALLSTAALTAGLALVIKRRSSGGEVSEVLRCGKTWQTTTETILN